ncbi:YqhG family protein [Tumebacillus algifaecis]|uniref:YqhG family protein n=1 Tax=Tumebacillus algifaecis TaxID=1214604 RepID=UPI0012FDFDD6|nr:YqhG family protein [Tumebacillus algifaecis]
MENQQEIQDFCRRYFQAVGATILVDQVNFLQVELPRDVDKELTDRPYYWMYVEAIGQEVPNSVLSLAFDPDLVIEGVERMEFVTLGSFRLNKIIESTQKRGRVTKAYQLVNAKPLAPYLMTTFKLSYIADRRRDEIVSYGVHLGTGEVVPEFDARLANLPFRETPPAAAMLQPVQLSLAEGYRRLKASLTEQIERLDHSWAEQAEAHLAQELEQLETYYESLGLLHADESKTAVEQEKKAALYAAERELRVAELRWRCAPRVQIEPFHFGWVYVADDSVRNTFTGNRLSM